MIGTFEPEIKAARETRRAALVNVAKQGGTISLATMRLLKPLNALDNVNNKLNAAFAVMDALGCEYGRVDPRSRILAASMIPARRRHEETRPLRL